MTEHHDRSAASEHELIDRLLTYADNCKADGMAQAEADLRAACDCIIGCKSAINVLKRRITDDAQPQQEPVAWRVKFKGDTCWTLYYSDPRKHPDDSERLGLQAVQPLYAAQPPAAPVETEEDDETIARRLAVIFHGDDVEWKGFVTKAHHWMSLSIDAQQQRARAHECCSAGTAEPRAFYEAASREYLIEQAIGLTAALEESRQEVASLRNEPQPPQVTGAMIDAGLNGWFSVKPSAAESDAVLERSMRAALEAALAVTRPQSRGGGQ